MRLIVSMALIAAFLFFLMVKTVWITSPKALVVFDSSRLKAEFIHQLALHNASDDAIARQSLRFKTHLQTLLSSYAQKKKVVIVDSERVLAGGSDITSVIASQLSAAMRGKP